MRTPRAKLLFYIKKGPPEFLFHPENPFLKLQQTRSLGGFNATTKE